MASKITIFPALNSLSWRPASTELPDQFNLKSFEDAFQIEQVRPNDLPKCYAQPVQWGDKKTRLYLETTSDNAIIYRAYALDGTLLYGTNNIANAVFTDNTEDGAQLYTHYLNLNTELGYEGFMQYQVEVGYDDGTTEYFLSEVVHMKEKHEDTLWIEYHNATNIIAERIRFEYLQCQFGIRVPGYRPELELGSDTVVAEGYDKETRPIKADSFRVWKFTIGGNEGIPDWLCDKLNRIKNLSFIRIENVRYTPQEDTKVELQEVKNYPLKAATFKLRDHENNPGKYDSSDVVTVMELTGYPSAIPLFRMLDTSVFNPIDNKAFVFYNSDGLEDYKDYLNNTFADIWGLEGTFDVVGDTITYENGQGETFINITQIVYTLYTTINITLTDPELWRYNFAFGGKHVVDWGETGVVDRFQTYESTNLTNYSAAQHTYSDDGSYTVNIFHNGTIRKLAVNNSTYGKAIRNVSGDLPAQLDEFDFRYNDLSALTDGPDMSIFIPCRNTLKSLIWSNSQIEQFDGSVLQGSGGWNNLAYVDFRKNKLNSAAIDAFFNNRVQYVVPYASQYRVDLQTPAAPPTNTSLFARQQLQVALGCTLYTD